MHRQSRKQGMTGDCKLIESSARTDHKGTCNRRKDGQKFFSLWEDPLLNTGYNQNNDGGKILQNGSCSGIGIIDRHKKLNCVRQIPNREKKRRVLQSCLDFQIDGRGCVSFPFWRNSLSSTIRISPALTCRIQSTTGVGRERSCSRYCPEHPESPQHRVARIMQTVPTTLFLFQVHS